jgi:ketosteroid isomerase-like protein
MENGDGASARDTAQAMSQENAEVVRRDVAARAARDWSTLDQIWHPEIELVLVGGSGTFTGIDEITQFFDSLSDSYRDYRVEAHEVIDAGERIVTVEWVAGRGLKDSASEAWIHTDLFRVIGFEEGKIRRIEEYPSRAEALEAAGLSE